jgi:2,5-furandicarboxylate decarboxylase 1
MAVFALSTLVKSVVIVDQDVDIHDDEDVAWAVATRVRAECDLLVVPRSRGSSLDPTTVDGTVTKLGIDATVPPSERERYARMRVAPSDVQTIGRYLAEAGVPVRSRG